MRLWREPPAADAPEAHFSARTPGGVGRDGGETRPYPIGRAPNCIDNNRSPRLPHDDKKGPHVIVVPEVPVLIVDNLLECPRNGVILALVLVVHFVCRLGIGAKNHVVYGEPEHPCGRGDIRPLVSNKEDGIVRSGRTIPSSDRGNKRPVGFLLHQEEVLTPETLRLKEHLLPSIQSADGPCSGSARWRRSKSRRCVRRRVRYKDICTFGGERQNLFFDADGKERPEWRKNGKNAQDKIIVMRKNKMKSNNQYFSSAKSAVFPAPPVPGPRYKTQMSASVPAEFNPGLYGGAVMAAHPARCKFSAPEQHCAFFGARHINLNPTSPQFYKDAI